MLAVHNWLSGSRSRINVDALCTPLVHKILTSSSMCKVECRDVLRGDQRLGNELLTRLARHEMMMK